MSKILRLGRNNQISLCLRNHFNANLSLQQDRDHLITEFRDPRILAFSTESHFNWFQISEIIFSLRLNLCKLPINKQRGRAGKWNLFDRTREEIADIKNFHAGNHCFTALISCIIECREKIFLNYISNHMYKPSVS